MAKTRQKPKKTTKKRRIVPLKRTLKSGLVGSDVVALKRALGKVGCYDTPKGKKITNQYGKYCKAGVKKFQKKKKMPQDGVYGPRTHKQLLPHFDDYGAYLMGRAPSALTLRDRVANEATWGYNNRGRISYRQERPMRSLKSGHKLPQVHDCSGYATACYLRAGAPDPNGMGYSGYGYTGTLSTKGRSVSLAAARPGDLVFYGSGWPYTHVAIYVGFGKVISHGSNKGPYLLAVDYRGDRRVIRSYLP